MRLAVRNDEKDRWERHIPYTELYKIGTVAQILGVGSAQVYSALKRGTVKGYTLGGVKVIKHEDLLVYLERRTATIMPTQELQEIVPTAPEAPVAIVATILDELNVVEDEVEVVAEGLDIFDESPSD